MNAQKESFVAVKDADNKLVAVVHHDLKSRHQVIYRVEEMSDEEITSLLNKTSNTGTGLLGADNQEKV